MLLVLQAANAVDDAVIRRVKRGQIDDERIDAAVRGTLMVNPHIGERALGSVRVARRRSHVVLERRRQPAHQVNLYHRHGDEEIAIEHRAGREIVLAGVEASNTVRSGRRFGTSS